MSLANTKFNMTNTFYKRRRKTTSYSNVSSCDIDTTTLTLYRYHNGTYTFIANVIFVMFFKHRNTFAMSYPRRCVDYNASTLTRHWSLYHNIHISSEREHILGGFNNLPGANNFQS